MPRLVTLVTSLAPLFALALSASPAVAQPDSVQPDPAPAQPVAAEPVPPVEPIKPEPAPGPARPVEPAAEPATPAEPAKPAKHEPPWYERLSVRGYAQFRFNRAGATNDKLKNDLGDKAIGDNTSFSIRRARLVVSGDVAPFLAVYLQPDFAGSAGDTLHVAVMRDWYGDIFFDKAREFRVRVGQSKIPFGFENLQSSQNRAPLDRSDALNSGVPGERDLGAIFYWAPDAIRKRFKHLVDSGLKGSGDYGVVGLGVYNGQTINQKEKNDNRHVVARVTYPFAIGDTQILEAGLSGYLGKYNVTTADGIDNGNASGNFRDMRVAASVVLYPQPVGFQAEYNIGKGPELVDTAVELRNLHGGYAMTMVRLGDFLPYARGAYYAGGIKTVTNAPRHVSKELEIGVEWQYKKRVELTAAVDIASRSVNGVNESGAFGRIQLQLNY